MFSGGLFEGVVFGTLLEVTFECVFDKIFHNWIVLRDSGGECCVFFDSASLERVRRFIVEVESQIG